MKMLKEINEKRMIDELIELIKIPSPSKNEREISNLLIEKFSSLGLNVYEDSSYQKTNCSSGNLICHLNGKKDKDPIMFVAHMDTVQIKNKITPKIQNGYLMSDGTTILGTDNKVAIAVFLEVVRQIKENNLLHGDIQFILTAGEELGLIGAKAIDRSLLKAKYGYMLDHTGEIGSFVTKGKHYKKMIITFKVPINKHISAIKIATQLIKRIRIGKIDDDLTVQINYFSGENEEDLTHEYVKIGLDIKSFFHKKINNEIEQIENKINELTYEYDYLKYKIKTNLKYNGFYFQEDDQVVKIATRAAKQINLKHRFISTQYSSDANVFTNFGIPVLNLAVGYENIHTNREKYKLNHLKKLVKLVMAIIEQSAKVEKG